MAAVGKHVPPFSQHHLNSGPTLALINRIRRWNNIKQALSRLNYGTNIQNTSAPFFCVSWAVKNVDVRNEKTNIASSHLLFLLNTFGMFVLYNIYNVLYIGYRVLPCTQLFCTHTVHIPALELCVWISQQTRYIDPILGQCYGGSTLTQHWVNVSCLLGWVARPFPCVSTIQMTQCWTNVKPALGQAMTPDSDFSVGQ